MITAEQRRERMNHIGSSDAPAIVGVDPWKTAGDVYWSKLNELPISPNEAMMTGIRMEPIILDFAEERLGPLIRDLEYIDDHDPELAANLDARILGKDEGVEAKYVGIKSADFWGEPETDDVPDHVSIQVQHQMWVADLEAVWVPVAIVRPYRGLVFEMFRVERDDDLIDDLVTAELAFWKNHVMKKIPPANSPASLEILKRIHREPASVLELDDQAATLWSFREEAAILKKVAETVYDQATAAVLAALGPFEAGKLPDGRLIVYVEESAGKRMIDPKTVQADYPHLFETTTRRVLRLKKGSKS